MTDIESKIAELSLIRKIENISLIAHHDPYYLRVMHEFCKEVGSAVCSPEEIDHNLTYHPNEEKVTLTSIIIHKTEIRSSRFGSKTKYKSTIMEAVSQLITKLRRCKGTLEVYFQWHDEEGNFTDLEKIGEINL